MNTKSVWSKVVLSASALAVLAGCGASTDLTGMWTDPTLTEGAFSKVLVIGLSDNEVMRRAFETQVTGDFASHGVQSVASVEYMPLNVEMNEATLREYFGDMGIDAVLVSRLLGVDEEVAYMPGDTYVVPSTYYNGFYGYYGNAYGVVTTPGYWSTYQVAKMETNLYRVGDAKLVWGGISETFDYADAMDGIRSFSHTVVGSLVSKGYFAKTK